MTLVNDAKIEFKTLNETSATPLSSVLATVSLLSPNSKPGVALKCIDYYLMFPLLLVYTILDDAWK